MSNINAHILSKAPINTTHWHIATDRYLRIGNAVIDGYLNLNILRSMESQKLILEVPKQDLEQILLSVAPGADAYSLASGKYLRMTDIGFEVFSKNGKTPIQCQTEIKNLVLISHIIGHIVNQSLLREQIAKSLNLSA
ncbi:hypothetical protein [Acinetobacter calcoaceticus]|uniref:hypothetical protein n=1 Tax=Acinetobacter calcoaceticus TaxID=471 RepID=UPI003007F38F